MDSKTTARNSDDLMEFSAYHVGEGVFCGTRNAESCQPVICGKFNADFFSAE